jgi:hypothetical protein
MININTANNKIICTISNDAKINQSYFPLKFQVLQLVTNKIIWETELTLGSWASWNSIRDVNFRVLTENHIILKEINYDYSNEESGDGIYEFWDYFCRINKKSTGLILGAGDGTWGEWVIPTNREKINCHLVEATDSTFLKLKEVYSYNYNFTLHNSLISIDGLEYKFYEGDHFEGLNTINYDYLKKTNGEASSNFVMKKSKSILDLLKEIGNIDWIRIDLEGIDYEILKKIPTDYLKSLILIQYEHQYLSDDERNELDNIIIPLGFKKITYNIDTIYTK